MSARRFGRDGQALISHLRLRAWRRSSAAWRSVSNILLLLGPDYFRNKGSVSEGATLSAQGSLNDASASSVRWYSSPNQSEGPRALLPVLADEPGGESAGISPS